MRKSQASRCSFYSRLSSADASLTPSVVLHAVQSHRRSRPDRRRRASRKVSVTNSSLRALLALRSEIEKEALPRRRGRGVVGWPVTDVLTPVCVILAGMCCARGEGGSAVRGMLAVGWRAPANQRTRIGSQGTPPASDRLHSEWILSLFDVVLGAAARPFFVLSEAFSPNCTLPTAVDVDDQKARGPEGGGRKREEGRDCRGEQCRGEGLQLDVDEMQTEYFGKCRHRRPLVREASHVEIGRAHV